MERKKMEKLFRPPIINFPISPRNKSEKNLEKKLNRILHSFFPVFDFSSVSVEAGESGFLWAPSGITSTQKTIKNSFQFCYPEIKMNPSPNNFCCA
jgi:hypothetical protein